MSEDLLCSFPLTFQDPQVWLGLALNYPSQSPVDLVYPPPHF